MRRSGSILVALATALGTFLGFAPPLAAQEQDSPPSVVVDIAAAQANDSEALAQVARELLGRLSVQVRATQVRRIDLAAIATAPIGPPAGAPGEAPLARVWIDWMTPGRATLYLLDARHDRLLVRQVERPAGGEELAREELGHILETACEGLLAGGEVGEPRAGVVPRLVPAPPRPPVVAEAVPAPPEPARWQVGLLYEAAMFAPEAPLTHGPLASVMFAPRGEGPRVGIWATAQLRLPVRVADEMVGVSTQTGALRAMFAFEQPLSERVAGRVGVGGGVDVVHATPEAPMPDRAVLEGARTLAFPVARAAIGFDVRLSRRLALLWTIAADVDVTGQRYVFRRASGEDAVLGPWLVRPAAALGLAFP